MKKKPVILLIMLGMIAFSATVVAQELWSLEKCINYAFENNLTVKQSKLDVLSADENLTQSKLNLIPSLNSTFGQNFAWGRAPDPQTNIYINQQSRQSFISLNSEITLFNGLQQINNIRQKQFDYLAKKYDSDKIRDDISLNIAAAYLSILFNLELANNAQRQVDISKEQIARTEKQVEAGTVARGNLYDIQAQGANDEANLVDAKNKLIMAYIDLKQLLDIPANAKFDIVKPKLEITGTPTLLPPGMIYNKSVTIMPQIKSAENKVYSAQRSLAMAKGMRSPRLFATGSYGTSYSNRIVEDPFTPDSPTKPFDKQLSDNRNGALYFGLSIPIFNGYQVSTNVLNAKILNESVNISLKQQKLQLRKNIESAYADAIAAYQTFKARNKSVESYRESFKYTEEKFNVGMVTSTDYNVAKIQLSNAESDLAGSKYDYIFKVKILDFYLGKSLTLSDIAGVRRK
ncbi:MAG TPA: TolC family protein [Bacteroidetes bacterium]|nr:TolC family protein [Bacteroidota bacterium]